MAQHRYRQNKVKREHTIIEGLLPILERISTHPKVQSVTPGRINPRSGNRENDVTVQYHTPTGFKLLGRSSRAVQEVFVVTDDAAAVLESLRADGIIADKAPTASTPAAAAPSNPDAPSNRNGQSNPDAPIRPNARSKPDAPCKPDAQSRPKGKPALVEALPDEIQEKMREMVQHRQKARTQAKARVKSNAGAKSRSKSGSPNAPASNNANASNSSGTHSASGASQAAGASRSSGSLRVSRTSKASRASNRSRASSASSAAGISWDELLREHQALLRLEARLTGSTQE